MHEPIILDGKEIASDLEVSLAKKVQLLKAHHKFIPGLAVILVGENPASAIYVSNKIASCKRLGINSFFYQLPAETSENTLLNKIQMLNNDHKVHGILVQLPLPDHIDKNKVINIIEPEKDADGFHPQNMGKLLIGQDGLFPCTPNGCLLLLKTLPIDLAGKNVVVAGRSNIVGKPMAMLLLKENCTVTIVHSKTVDIEAHTREADILVAAMGVPGLIKKDWVKQGAVVIDVGINKLSNSNTKTIVVGDVDYEEVAPKCYAITPVPGGVGPMTIYSLMENTVKAACMQKNIDFYKLEF